MESHSSKTRPRLKPIASTLLATLACVPAYAVDGSEASGLNAWALFGGLFAVLALGLYLQSTRRRMA